MKNSFHLLPIFMIIFMVIFLVLSACTSVREDYKFGDVSRTAMNAIDRYCDENEDEMIRQIALGAVRAELPGIPENGICELRSDD